MRRNRGLIATVALALALLSGCGHERKTGPNWIVFASDRDGRWDVYAIHPDGRGLIRVTSRRDEMQPQLATSPNGARLAIVSPGGTMVIDSSGRRETHKGGDMYATPYVSNAGHVTLASGEGPTVSPDGKHRAFVDRRGVLWIRAKQGSRPRRVARADEGPRPIWSPDGRWLAFGSPRGQRSPYPPTFQLAVVRADGSGLRVLTRSTHGDDDYPTGWAPDGRSILFVRGNSYGVGPSALDQVWTTGTDGTGVHALTHAYPHGGENIRPVSFRGTLRATAPLPPVERTTHAGTRTILRTRYLVGEVRASGERVALLPLPHSPQTPRPTFPLLIWSPHAGTTQSWPIPACAWPERLLFEGRVAAFDCNNSCCDSIDEAVLVLRVGDPLPFEAARGEAAGSLGGTFLWGFGLDQGRLVYGMSKENPHRLYSSGLWQVVDRKARRIGRLAGTVVGYSAQRVAVSRVGAVDVFDERGRLRYSVALPGVDVPSPGHFRFASEDEPRVLIGPTIGVILNGRHLQAWVAATGRAVGSWTVPQRAHLEDVSGRRALLVVGRSLHVLDVATGRETVLRFPAARRIPSTGGNTTGFYAETPIRAALDGRTLVVSYNVSSRSAEPGRVIVLRLP